MVIRGIENSGNGEENSFSPVQALSRIFLSIYRRAVIASEDGSFLVHNGFDFKACKTYKSNERGLKNKKGSTISTNSQKCISMAGRNLLRKGLEAYFTVLIESGARRIMGCT
jgi:monofunctional biosynthetic peptidoglycan transglycosylase